MGYGPTAGQVNETVIKVINDVQNIEQLSLARQKYEYLQQQILAVSNSISGSAQPMQQEILLLEQMALASDKAAKEIKQLESSLAVTAGQSKNLAEAIRSGSYAFQDFAQGGFGAIINNTDRLGTSVGRLLGIGAELGPWIQGIATAAFLVTENWGTIAKLFGSTPSDDFIHRLHISSDWVKKLGDEALQSRDKYLLFLEVQGKQRAETEAATRGRIEAKPTEGQAASAKAIVDYIAEKLGGSEGRVFGGIGQGDLRRYIRETDPTFSAAAQDVERLRRLTEEAAAYAKTTQAQVAMGGPGAEVTARRAISEAQSLKKQFDEAAAKAEEDLTVRINQMFAGLSRTGAASRDWQMFQSFLQSRGQDIRELRSREDAARWEAGPEGKRQAVEDERAKGEAERQSKEAREKSTSATHDATQAMSEFSKAIGNILADLRQEARDRPEDAGTLIRQAQERAGGAYGALRFRLGGRVGPGVTDLFGRADEQMGDLSRTFRDIAMSSAEAVARGEAKAKRESDQKQRQADQKAREEQRKAEAAERKAEAAERETQQLRAFLGKSPVEANAMALIAQQAMYGGPGAKVDQQIQQMLRSALFGRTDISRQRAEELVARGPELYRAQFSGMLGEARSFAGAAGANRAQAQQFAIQQVLREIIAGQQAQAIVNQGNIQAIGQLKAQAGAVKNKFRQQVTRQRR